ncbi:SHOCT domain-containing protein [Hymenobacter armeniacus]|uniref:SHOCT domain-containing protein n=1 Tax=Hymenobacter armeniacus TaxID=2771358 RepID=A0ABR8JY63_9BACT|nr:SHOCT domain-containing protein [Hymenobacter armeniacus]MBD2722694.1 SHOCT domain-containing protein [Hymenobacter armeniacus]
MLAEINGQNGKLMVFEDHITLSRATFNGFMSQGGFVGERIYFYKDIVTIEYKKPTFFSNGYFKFIVPGTEESDATVGPFYSSPQSMTDPNTIVLRAFSSKVGDKAEKIHKLVMEKLFEAKLKQPGAGMTTSNKMDELKKLGELKASGILTNDEFESEKNKLLSSC